MRSTAERPGRANTARGLRRRGGVLLATCLLLAGASCEQQRPDPPVPVAVKEAVPVFCQVPEPECRVPAYDAAQREMAGDVKVKLLRAEAVTQEDCVRLYRLALAACRKKAD